MEAGARGARRASRNKTAPMGALSLSPLFHPPAPPSALADTPPPFKPQLLQTATNVAAALAASGKVSGRERARESGNGMERGSKQRSGRPTTGAQLAESSPAPRARPRPLHALSLTRKWLPQQIVASPDSEEWQRVVASGA